MNWRRWMQFGLVLMVVVAMLFVLHDGSSTVPSPAQAGAPPTNTTTPTSKPMPGAASRPAAASQPAKVGKPAPLPSSPADLTTELLEEALGVLRDQDPDLERRIREAQRKYPNQVREMLVKAWPKLKSLIELKRSEPDMFKWFISEIKLTRQIDEQAIRIRTKPNPQTMADDRKRLKELIERRFDVRQKLLELDIEKRAERLKVMRNEYEKRASEKESTVENDVRALIGAPKQP